MPISFLEQASALAADAKLKARLLVREFASHRYGIFKESGFRADLAYPPFASLAGLAPASAASAHQWRARLAPSLLAELAPEVNASDSRPPANDNIVRGFDEHWAECAFDTAPTSGLPEPRAAHCAPYLTRAPAAASFNLMSSDPFAYAPLGPGGAEPVAQWRDVAETARWHFCGDNFPAGESQQAQQGPNKRKPAAWFEHNQRATNKQNKMCAERSALDVIRSSDDFRRAPFR